MDFDLTEEQSMLVASCERLVRERCGFDGRRAQARQLPQMRPPLWTDLTELGLTGIAVPEALGGMARPLIDGALVAQTLGRGWLLEPYIDCALAAAAILSHAPGSTARDTGLAAIARGLRIIVPATHAQRGSSEMLVQAPHGAYADVVLVYVDDQIQALMTTGARKRGWRQFDGTPACELGCPTAGMMLIAEGEAARIAWQAGQVVAKVGRIAEGVGLAKTVLDATADYLRTRRQFGQPIGRFQALAHRMADLAILYEQAQSLMLAAAMRSAPAGSGFGKGAAAANGAAADAQAATVAAGAAAGAAASVNAAARTLDAAQVVAHRAFRAIGQQAIQMHGGIGMTDEYAVSHYVKRLLAIELELGDVDSALRRFADAAA
jgi:alkylation response protein AidB-like acyl-CoA dehydrogenase